MFETHFIYCVDIYYLLCVLVVCTVCVQHVSVLPVLQVLDAAETSEPAVHHDGHPGTQSLTLLHTGRDNTHSHS